MRTELASLDLYYLLRELKVLEDAKIDKIYQIDKHFLFQVYAFRKGKKYLNIHLPSFIFLSDEKPGYDKPGKFAFALRRHLDNTIIRELTQIDFERIIRLTISSKEKKFKLYIELFSPGNIILCDEEDKIIIANKYKGFGSRLIRPGIKYDYPKKDYNFLTITKTELKKIIKESEKRSIVVTLAVNLGLGGSYAEEICALAKVDKDKKEIDDKEIEKLYDAISILKKKQLSPTEYYKENVLENISPICLETFEKFDKKEIETFSKGLDKFLSEKIKKKQKGKATSAFEKDKKKYESIIQDMENQIKGLGAAHKANKEKGEYIYQEYTNLENVLNQVRTLVKENSPKKIKEKIKGTDIVKSIDLKNKEVVVELK